MDRKERSKQEDEDLKACHEYANTLPLPKKEREQVLKTCLVESSLINPDQHAKIKSYCSILSDDPKLVQKCKGFKLLNPNANAEILLEKSVIQEVATCESGRKYAPTDKVEQEFMEWCLTQIPIPAQITVSGTYKTTSNENSEGALLSDSSANDPTLEDPLIELIPGRVYAYNHYKYMQLILKNENKWLEIDKFARLQMSLFPQMILFFLGDKIILLDPIGREEFTNFYQVPYRYLIETLMKKVKEKLGATIDLSKIRFQIAISHSHPDHWSGLPIFLESCYDLIPPIDRSGQKQLDFIIHREINDFVSQKFHEEFLTPNAPFINLLGWSDPFLITIREQLYYRLYGEPIDLDQIVGLARTYSIELNFIMLEDPPGLEKSPFNLIENSPPLQKFKWLSTKGIHSDRSLGFIYGDPLIFLQDLFIPSYALVINSTPYSNYSRLAEFYSSILKPFKKFFWSHHYLDRRGPSEEFQIPADYRILKAYYENLSDLVDLISIKYNNSPKRRSLPEFIKEIYANDAIFIKILNCLQIEWGFRNSIREKTPLFNYYIGKHDVKLEIREEEMLILLGTKEHPAESSMPMNIFRYILFIHIFLLNILL